MIDVVALQVWLARISSQNFVAIDEGGLTLVALDPDGKETGDYLEIGGTPEEEEA